MALSVNTTDTDVQRRYEVQIRAWHLSGELQSPVWEPLGRTSRTQTEVIWLTPSTTFDIRVRSINTVGASEWVTSTFTTSSASIPGSVVNLRATNITGGSFVLQWCSPPHTGGVRITQYTVGYQQQGAAEWTTQTLPAPGQHDNRVPTMFSEGDACPSPDLKLVIAGQPAGAIINVHVVAESPLGTSPTSPAQFSLGPPSPPSPPTLLRQTLPTTGGSLTVSWGSPTDLGGLYVTSYAVSATDASSGFVVAERAIAVSPGDQGPYTAVLYGLNNHAEYRVRVSAVNTLQAIGSPAETIARTASVATDPGQCSQLRVTERLGGSLRIAWAPPLDTGGHDVSRYIVAFGEIGKPLNELSLHVEVPEVFIPGLLPLTSYSISVRAVTAWTIGQYSNPAFIATTGTATPPLAPEIVSFTRLLATSGELNVVEGSNGGDSVSHFHLSRVDTSSGAVTTKTSTTAPLPVDDLTIGLTYTFVVVAQNSAGTSPPSSPFNVTVTEPSNSASVSVGRLSRNTIDLAWVPPLPMDGISYLGYQIVVDDGSTRSVYATVGTAVHEMEVTGLVSGLTYTIFLHTLYVKSGRRLAQAPTKHWPTTRSWTAAHATRSRSEQLRIPPWHRQLEESPDFVSNVTVRTASNSTAMALRTEVGEVSVTYTPNADEVVLLERPPESVANRVLLTFTRFSLECDHDEVIVSLNDQVLWRGGCVRMQEFSISADVGSNPKVTVRLVADGSVQGAGITFSFVWSFQVSSSSVSSVMPSAEACPGVDYPCSGETQGACMMTGRCLCSSGYSGEDCSALVLCPGPLCEQALSQQYLADESVFSRSMIAVAQWGNDTQGSGWIGRPLPTELAGSVPKPFRTVAAALKVAPENATIVVYPGRYTECGQTLQGSEHGQHLIAAFFGSTLHSDPTAATHFVCSREGKPFLLLHNTRITLTGFLIHGSNSAGLVIQGGEVGLNHMSITNCSHPHGGGALRITQAASVSIKSLTLDSCTSTTGGGLYIEGSKLDVHAQAVVPSVVRRCNSSVGGGLACHNCTVHGASLLQVTGCTARFGGGAAVSGASSITSLTLRGNIATEAGGGLATRPLSDVHIAGIAVTGNVARGTGGGGAFLESSTVRAYGVDISGNQAIQGGGVLIQESRLASNETALRKAITVHSNCAEGVGGGVMMVGTSALASAQVFDNVISMECGSLGVRSLPSAQAGGAGVAILGSINATLVNVAIVNNSGISFVQQTMIPNATSAMRSTNNSTAQPRQTLPVFGGGLLVSNRSRVTIGGGVLVSANTASGGGNGGGVLIRGASKMVGTTPNVGVDVVGNVASGGCGGGVAVEGGSVFAGGYVAANTVHDAAGTAVGRAVGGGGLCVYGGSSAMVSGVTIHNNSAQDGGGIFVGAVTGLTAHSLVVTNNRACYGAGMHLLEGSQAVSTLGVSRVVGNSALGCTFITDELPPLNNSPGGYGGGILCNGCAVVDSWDIFNNTGTTGAGVALGVWSTRTGASVVVSPRLRRCHAIGNEATESGGGLASFSPMHPSVSSSSFVANTAAKSGGGWFISNCTVSITDEAVHVSHSTAPEGGGVFLQGGNISNPHNMSQHVLEIHQCHAGAGGGLFMLVSGCHTNTVNAVRVEKCSAIDGGGIAVIGSKLQQRSDARARATMSSIMIVGCTALGSGGGLHAATIDLRVTNTSIENATATVGAGLCAQASVLDAEHVEVSACTAASQGGGIMMSNSTISSSSGSVRVFACSAALAGGGVSSASASANAMAGLVIQGCFAPSGGGVSSSPWSHIDVADVAVHSARATNGGGGVAVVGDSSVSWSGGSVLHCHSNQDGGGLLVVGTVVMTHGVLISHNYAAQNGGGVAVLSGGLLQANFTKWSFNTAANAGGAASVNDAIAEMRKSTILDCTIHSSFRDGQGGAFFVKQGLLRVIGSIVKSQTSSNHVLQGGAVAVTDAVNSDRGFFMEASTMIGFSANIGGAIHATNALVTMVDSVVAHASASSFGGCVFASVSYGPLVLYVCREPSPTCDSCFTARLYCEHEKRVNGAMYDCIRWWSFVCPKCRNHGNRHRILWTFQ